MPSPLPRVAGSPQERTGARRRWPLLGSLATFRSPGSDFQAIIDPSARSLKTIKTLDRAVLW